MWKLNNKFQKKEKSDKSSKSKKIKKKNEIKKNITSSDLEIFLFKSDKSREKKIHNNPQM